MRVVIHDVKTGCWELNELKHKLVHEYTPGLSTIMILPVYKKITITKDTQIQKLTAPKWYEYILFGLTLLFNKIKRKFQ